MSEVPGVGETAGLGLESVSCHEDLVKLLAERFVRADVSLRELQARADKAGGARLPRTTCADMLAGRRFPKKAVMVAFLRGCRVPDHELPAWERAWERVRVGRLSGRTAVDDHVPPASHDTPPPAAPEPGASASGGWRRRGVLAAAVVVVVLGVIVVLRLEGQGEMPDGVPAHVVDPAHVVSDDGRAFPRGGSSRFTVRVSAANTGVRLIRRLDVGVGLQDATVTVNGTPAARWRPLLEDGVYKWRNQIVDVPPKLTAGRRSLAVVNTCVSASGCNEFLYTVEHEVNGVWSIADTVDVGRDHTASEAAHDYRVVGEDWADRQTFAYPPRKEDWNVR
ncbi:hypothetical protein ACIBIZ_09550 [Nonomuraea spiralis]|uniref:hypothetical protein n=1 Tax=Nonomuraea spiralis TaxID=46182 RepID=UPI0037AC3308